LARIISEALLVCFSGSIDRALIFLYDDAAASQHEALQRA
jgi:hypothetical protein